MRETEKSAKNYNIIHLVHMCHGAHRDKGSHVLKVRNGCQGEIQSTLRPERNEL